MVLDSIEVQRIGDPVLVLVWLNIFRANVDKLDEDMRARYPGKFTGLRVSDTMGAFFIEPVSNELILDVQQFALAHNPDEMSAKQMEQKAQDDLYQQSKVSADVVRTEDLALVLDPEVLKVIVYLRLEVQRLRKELDARA